MQVINERRSTLAVGSARCSLTHVHVNVTLIHLMPELSKTIVIKIVICKILGLVVSSSTNVFRQVFASPLNLDTSVLFRKRHRRKSMNKCRIKSLVSRWSASFDFSFSVEEKQTRTCNFKTYILNLLSLRLYDHWLMTRHGLFLSHSKWQVSDCDRNLSKKCFKVCLEAF